MQFASPDFEMPNKRPRITRLAENKRWHRTKKVGGKRVIDQSSCATRALDSITSDKKPINRQARSVYMYERNERYFHHSKWYIRRPVRAEHLTRRKRTSIGLVLTRACSSPRSHFSSEQGKESGAFSRTTKRARFPWINLIQLSIV